MENSVTIRSLQTPHLMSNCATARISRVRIGGRSKQSALKTATAIRVIHSQYIPHYSSSSLYDVLSVSPNATARDIKSAYRRMALKYHPDVCPAAEKKESTKQFLKAQDAYNTLSDPLLRQDYDWKLQNMFAVGEHEERLESSHVWEVQLMELIRRRSSNTSSWGSTMRRRNQQTAYGGAAC